MEIFELFNPIAWIVANCILAYISFSLLLFVIMYYVLFDPKATTGGKFIFRFMVSLVGMTGIIFLGIYVDPAPAREWFLYPEGILWWRPALRLFVYGYVAFTITSLASLLVKRKWFPRSIDTAPSSLEVKVRHETSDIPIVKDLDGS